MPIKSKQ